jgi:hypothetical protein
VRKGHKNLPLPDTHYYLQYQRISYIMFAVANDTLFNKRYGAATAGGDAAFIGV